MNKTIKIAVGLLTLVLLSCQKTEPQQQRDKDEENGFVVAQELSNSRVQCIAEDKAGQLWIGTFRGCQTTKSRTCSATSRDGSGWQR